MNRWLLLGYVANVAVILASLLTARGAIPGLDDGAALAASQGVLLLLFPAVGRAGYEDDTGFTSLAARLGSSLPKGSGISVSMVESGAAYLPQAGSGTFAGSGAFSGNLQR